MKKTLICSHNPILVKSLYGLLIEEGLTIEVVDHITFAIKRIIEGDIGLLLMDSSIFGLSMNEAIEIIRDVDPDLPYIMVSPFNLDDSNHEILHYDPILSIEAHDLERLRSILRVIKEPVISICKGVKNEA